MGWLGSYRRGVGLNQRIRLRELVHMAKQRAGGALATWPRRGAHLLRPRLPAASAASSRATTSAHRTPVLAVLLPAHCTAKTASSNDGPEVRSRSWRRLCGPRRAEENGGFEDQALACRARHLVRSGWSAIKSPCHRRWSGGRRWHALAGIIRLAGAIK